MKCWLHDHYQTADTLADQQAAKAVSSKAKFAAYGQLLGFWFVHAVQRTCVHAVLQFLWYNDAHISDTQTTWWSAVHLYNGCQTRSPCSLYLNHQEP